MFTLDMLYFPSDTYETLSACLSKVYERGHGRKTHRHQAIDVGKMAFTLDTLFWAILYFVFISWMGCVETRSQGQIKRNYKNK